MSTLRYPARNAELKPENTVRVPDTEKFQCLRCGADLRSSGPSRPRTICGRCERDLHIIKR